ncbi:SufS family cysteine desulfurase [bacterium]|nr:SufS family cysteine desulfurase [bacterium]
MIDYKKDFPFFKGKNSSLIYLDSAATTQRLQGVLDAMNDYYVNYNASVHRAVYALGETATTHFEQVRVKVAQFINAALPEEIIFTSGTTDSLNKVSFSYEHFLSPGDEIVVTVMEHHSNFIPWQQLAQKTGAIFKVINLDDDYLLDTASLETLITARTKIVALTHSSNVISSSLERFKLIIDRAKKVGAITVIDGAQAIGYQPVNVQDLDIDFYAFSAHKMGGPTGVGVLYACKRTHKDFKPAWYGGGAVANVTQEKTQFLSAPYCYEPGTPAIAQVIGLGASVDYLQSIGMENVHAYIQKLSLYFLEKIKDLKKIKIIGNQDFLYQSSHLVSFVVEGMHPHDVAAYLGMHGICVRAGHHCTQPLMQVLGQIATVRVSFYLYNNKEEVDKLIQALEKI